MRGVALLALAGLAALAGCASRGDAGGAALVPVSQASERERALLVAYGEGGAAWEEARAAALADAALTRFLARNLVLEMVRAFDVARLAPLGEERGPFERARDELVRLGPPAVPLLAELLRSEDGVVRALAGNVLAGIGAPAVGEVTSALDDDEPRVRRTAAELLGELPHAGRGREEPILARLAHALREDPDWVVRAQAARTLGRRGARHVTTDPARDPLEHALADPDPLVRVEAARALATLGDPAAVPALLNLLERSTRDPAPRPHAAARHALVALLGEDAGDDPRAWRTLWLARRAAR